MFARKADIVIIGGGIIGAAIARELSKYHLDIVLLEKEPDLATGTTKANSAILHAGFDALPGTLKAQTNVRGNELYYDLQKDLGLEINWLGSLVVATSDQEMSALRKLLARGERNRVPGLTLLSREEVLEKEPELNNAVGALWAPTAGIFLPFNATIAFAENAAVNGVTILTQTPVIGIDSCDGRITAVQTPRGTIAASYVINAAGLYADEIAKLAGDNSFTICPRKGEYILFDKQAGPQIKHILFPAPANHSKGILIAPTVHGNTFIGPNAHLLDIDDAAAKENHSTTSEGLQEIFRGAQKLIGDISLQSAITEFSGLRAVSDNGDFIIRNSAAVDGLIHAAGIQSPGLTAAPAIAEMVVGLLRENGLSLEEKENFIAGNSPKISFRNLSAEQKHSLIQKNPLYGRVICRCETITEGEIVDAIHSPCGARTLDGVKRRTRAGMGRCQGGFCGPKVAAILARELQVPLTEIRKETAASYLFYEKNSADCAGGCHCE